MLQTELISGLLFVEQVGLALAGAAALWGFFFFINYRNAKEEGKKNACLAISEKLLCRSLSALFFPS